MDREVLFGLLLGYPPCCIRAFTEDKAAAGKRKAYKGFIPCAEHENADIVKLLGRSVADEPPEFLEFLETNMSFKVGLYIYRKHNKGHFFELCWWLHLDF